MKCENCGADVRENAKFCDECGSKIEISNEKISSVTETDIEPTDEIDFIESTENESLDEEGILNIKDEQNTPFYKKKPFIIIVIIIVVILILSIIATNSTNNGASNSQTTTSSQNNGNNSSDDVEYIGSRTVDYQEETEEFRVFFMLMDSSENAISSKGTAKIKITNNNNETVYDNEVNFDENDFTSWTNKMWDESKYMACIYIPKTDITPGTIEDGILSLSVTTDTATFDEDQIKINGDLPLEETTIILPSVPSTYKQWSYSGDTYKYKVEVQDISYELGSCYDGEQSVKMTFKVKMLEGSSTTAQISKIGYALKDSDGMIVDSGTLLFTQLFNDETAKEEKTFYNLKVGETYTLSLQDSK